MEASRPRRPSAWPDLPADLLGVVLGRLPSLADRVRLRAVCRPWRSSAASMLHQSPPQLPWLVYHDGALLDVSNNTAHRVRLPDDGAICYCAGDNMLFLLHDDGRCSLMNTFSSDVTPLPELAALLKARGIKINGITKVVMSSAPRLIAVLCGAASYGFSVFVTTCRPPAEINLCQVLTEKDDPYVSTIIDIAIFEGKIHVIASSNELLAVELNNDEQTLHFRSRILRASLPSTAPGSEVRQYLVESNGKLLMVRRWIRFKSHYVSRLQTCHFKVVDADLSHGRWNEVESLEGRALFVSMRCSKSVPGAAAGGDGAQQDCIYFLDEYNNVSRLQSGLWDSGAYSMGDGTITPLLPEEPAMPLPWKCPRECPAWFFPVEV